MSADSGPTVDKRIEMAQMLHKSVPDVLNKTSSEARLLATESVHISADEMASTTNQARNDDVATANQAAYSANRSAAATARPTSDETDGQQDDLVLKYGAAHVIKLFIPVTICLLFVIVSLSLITSYQKSNGATLIYTPFSEDSQQSSGTKLWMSVANASIFISFVIFMTVVLIALYHFRCYKFIHGWLAFSSLMLLFLFTYMFVSEFFKQFNLVTDMITVSVVLWNFGILGMVCIHWKGPLVLQQTFLIFTCVQMALIFIKYLPEWTTWVLLAFISIWDLIAVLTPCGPLKFLVETARSRNDQLFPAMVYSSALMYMMATQIDAVAANAAAPAADQQTRSNENEDDEQGGFQVNAASQHLPTVQLVTRTSRSNPNDVRRRSPNDGVRVQAPSSNSQRGEQHLEQQEDDEENGVKLGLGDFIFYSILVGKASILGDWNTVIACFIAILIGLCLTLVLLAVYHKPLPALPISLFFGLIFYFLTNLIVRPFYEELSYRQIFI